ncbi:MAG: zinc ribbon domain-containing protein [Methylobacter sp.]
MNCPKCQQALSAPSEICPHCGIVFAKYLKYHGQPTAQPDEQRPVVVVLGEDEPVRPLTQFLFDDAQQSSWPYFLGRSLVFVGLMVWSWQLMGATIDSNAVGNSFLHLVNLPFHEAGHVIFRPFGAFITSLGGTLGQLLMPLICALTLLLKTRDPFGASVALWWLGENFLDIAPYMNDARAGQLPLLGGNFGHSSPYGFHDWEYLLTETGLLQYDHVLAKAVFALGCAIMLLSMLWGGLLLYHNYKRVIARTPES